MATDVVPTLLEECKSPGQSLNIGLACKRLMVAVATAAALHGGASAQITIVSPADSAIAAAAKGYGQEAILKDGSKMSFAEIARLPSDKKDDVLDNKMKASQRERYDEWELQVANQTIENKKIIQQAAIEGNKGKLDIQQAAIEELAKNAKKLEGTIRIALQSGLKLPIDYRNTMNTVISFGKPPETVKYFKEILANPNNFSV